MPWLASPNYHPHLTHHFVSLKPRTPTPLNYEPLHISGVIEDIDPDDYVKNNKKYTIMQYNATTNMHTYSDNVDKIMHSIVTLIWGITKSKECQKCL